MESVLCIVRIFFFCIAAGRSRLFGGLLGRAASFVVSRRIAGVMGRAVSFWFGSSAWSDRVGFDVGQLQCFGTTWFGRDGFVALRGECVFELWRRQDLSY